MKTSYTNKIIVSLLLFVVVCTSCNDNDDKKESVQHLETSTFQFGNDKDEILNLFAFAGIDQLDDYLTHDVKIYELEYKTQYLGEEIIASGLVTFPDTSEPMPMLSFQHGTMVGHDEAPTVNRDYTLLSNLASAGYIFLIPDFIGFGSSSEVLHPYYHADLTANSILDMVQAAEELAKQEGFDFNGDLYLAGYSEGGFATMAAHKAYEEHPIDGIKLIASAPASGGYDVKGMQEYFFSLDTYHQPFYLAYVAMSYFSTYSDWTLSLSDMFNEPYATDIPKYFDGSYSGGDINDKLTNDVNELLTETFLDEVDTNDKFDELNDAFEENSLDAWVPEIRMIMYHGDADITVPYQNSVDAYENMITLGTSSDILSFISIEGGTHGTGFFPYVEDFIKKFDELK
ncbi:MAG: alpha/beta hydrolase [Reichenbachiella sp.]|uniref:alpha/beta hydrolase family protein n=1 Tax=Reichenbachiella sp. TaxID=2184521 RepID=UPI0032994B0E